MEGYKNSVFCEKKGMRINSYRWLSYGHTNIRMSKPTTTIKIPNTVKCFEVLRRPYIAATGAAEKGITKTSVAIIAPVLVDTTCPDGIKFDTPVGQTSL